jgi:hypothetical protein
MSEAFKLMLQWRRRVALDRASRGLAVFSLLLVAATVNAVDARVDVLDKATMSQLTHTTCSISPLGTGATNRFLLIEGPACQLGGGACPHVALMKIDRRTVRFVRIDEPRKSANGTWTSAFKQGAMTLSIDMVPRSPDRTQSDSDGQYGAVLTLNDGKGNTTMVKGVANCEDN